MAGDRLYVDVWDHQPPGAFVLFGLVGATFGNTDATYRVLATAASAVTCVLIYLVLARRKSLMAAMIGAGLFAITSADPGTAGDGCNREIFMNALVMFAVALLLWHERLRAFHLVMAGLMFGVASTLKTVMAAPWLMLTIWSCWQAWGIDRSWRTVTRTVFLMSIGPAVIWSGVAGYFSATARWAEFLDAVFWFNLGYANVDNGPGSRFAEFFNTDHLVQIMRSGIGIWLAGAIGFVVAAVRSCRRTGDSSGGTKPIHVSSPVVSDGDSVASPLVGGGNTKRRQLATAPPTRGDATEDPEKQAQRLRPPILSPPHSRRNLSIDPAVVLLMFGSYIAVCLPAQFWPHYYRLMWPALILASAIGIDRLPRPRMRAIAIMMVSAVTLTSQSWYYLLLPPHEIGPSSFSYRRAWARAVGEHVESLTDPDDSIFVWGNEAGIYHYANRRCASRYTMITSLVDNASGHEQRRQQLLAELKKNPPRLVMITEDEFDELKAYLQPRYIVAGLDYQDEDPETSIMIALTLASNPVAPSDWDWRAPWIDGDHE